ncbi:MAG: MATE family efflux transporter [Anaerolineae bacterium]|nr:MATE family efflux transporter [Anaerolineae bacterium]
MHVNWVSRDKALIRDVLRISLPVIGEHLVGLAVGVVNTRLVGHLGAAALAAVSLSTQWIFLTNVLFATFSMGATTLVAQSVGAGDWDTSNRTVRQVTLAGVAIGLVAAVLALLFAEPAMALMGAEPEALALGATYLRITASIFALSAVISMSGACLRGAGDTRTPMAVMTVVNVVSVAVSWVTINGMFGLPRLGVAGAALGMAVGCAIGATLFTGLLLKGHSGLKLDLRDLRPDLSMARRVLRIGLPKGVEQLVLHLAMMVFFRIVAGLGTVAVAANAVALRVESLSLMPAMGLAIASTTLVGQRLGAGDPKRVQRSGYLAYKIGACWMALMGLAFIFFPRVLIGFFTDEPMVIEMAVVPLRVSGLFAPLVAAELVFSACLLGAGDTRFPMIITCVSGWVMRVGGAVVLGLTLGLGLAGVWLGRASDVAVRGVILFLRFRGGRWKETRV